MEVHLSNVPRHRPLTVGANWKEGDAADAQVVFLAVHLHGHFSLENVHHLIAVKHPAEATRRAVPHAGGHATVAGFVESLCAPNGASLTHVDWVNWSKLEARRIGDVGMFELATAGMDGSVGEIVGANQQAFHGWIPTRAEAQLRQLRVAMVNFVRHSREETARIQAAAMDDRFNLQRFLDAQNPIYATVLAELAAGEKRSHWMWYVFPQIRGLGRTPVSIEYALQSRAEAEAYLQHPVLGARLRECVQLVLSVPGRSLEALFPYPDDLKFRSSMTLFEQCAPDPSLFRSALHAFCDGVADERTIALLNAR
jgi:uncharacterized protein (DUF1810 family)